MLFKVYILASLALLITAEVTTKIGKESETESVAVAVPFETSHKHPLASADDVGFQTSHKIGEHRREREQGLKDLQNSMNLLPTKERPELNPILSALINEDVMKSIEAKRAIEETELAYIKTKLQEDEAKLEEIATTTDVNYVLTTPAPSKPSKADLYDNLNDGFVDQTINFDSAGSENNKKSRIEIKKGPNGLDYEYEYVYYYYDDDDEAKSKSAPNAAAEPKSDDRGKSRYSNIDRNSVAPADENSLVSSRAKGRSSSVSNAGTSNDVEAERLPTNTRFPLRGKNADVQPTPALDSLENAAERKKISVKRPSLELVDSETFNTDEKQVKGTRNTDTEAKGAPVESNKSKVNEQNESNKNRLAVEKAREENEDLTQKLSTEDDSNVNDEQTTQTMEKAALDLYAILTNENFNLEMTTDLLLDSTTLLPDTTNSDGDLLTTIFDAEADEEQKSSSTTTTTTTTTTEPTTTTTTTTSTTTTTAAPAVGPYGIKRGGLAGLNRNRYKQKQTLTLDAPKTTEATTTAAPAEPTKAAGRNRFSRPALGGRTRKTTTAAPAPAAENAEEEVVAKEVKPVSSGFSRGRPRNRFNIRGTSTTEKSNAEADADAPNEETEVSSTTARTLRGRPGLNLRGRSRSTTTKAPVAEEAAAEGAEGADAGATEAEKPIEHKTPIRPSRFNFNRAGANKLLLTRGKLGRSTEAPVAAVAEQNDEDSTADSSHHKDVQDINDSEENAEKTETSTKGAVNSLNRLKNRPRLNNFHKTENVKPKSVVPGVSPIAIRKPNPLLARRRLPYGQSTTEAATVGADDDDNDDENEDKQEDKNETSATVDDGKNEDSTEVAEEVTEQARGLGLLGQRRRIPLRKPGTIL